jgi:hypothetical protein
VRIRDKVPGWRLLVRAMLGVGLVYGLPETAAATGPLILTPNISVSEQYNDNVFFDSSHTEDYVTSITPGLSLQYKQPRLTLSLSGNTSAQIYARQTSQNKIAQSQSGIFSASYLASPRLTVSLSDSVNRVGATRTGAQPTGSETTPPPVEPPSPDTGVSTLLPRGDVLSNSFASNAAYLLAPRWTGSIGYTNNLSNFTDPGGQNVTHRLFGGVSYAWRSNLSLGGSVSYSRYILTQATDTEAFSASAGSSYSYDPTFTLSASVGVYVNHPLQAGQDDISTSTGPTFNLTAEKTFEYGTLSLIGSQQITSSAGVAGLSITRSALLVYAMELAQHLTGSISTSYINFDTSQTNFQIVQVFAALNYSLSQYISTGLSYSYRWRDSTQTVPGRITAGTVDGNIVQLYLRASYPVWQGEL